MRVRRYLPSDFAGLSALYQKFFTELRASQGWQVSAIKREDAEEITSQSVKRGSWVFVAEDRGRLIGFSRVIAWEEAYFIREVYVEEPHRRRGMGSRLLAACEKLVQERGETSIFLTVEPKHSGSIEYLVSNGYDTLNMLELRKDLSLRTAPKREDNIEILGHTFQLLKRN
jgi:GNAT superfamily N-acetyltransferase